MLLCAGFLSLSAQDVYNSSGRAGGYKKKEKKGYDPDKLILGGGINANYSSVPVDDVHSGAYVQVGISPKVGYKVTDFLAVGVGIGYQYYKTPDYYFNNQIAYIHDNIYYPGIWTKCSVYKPLFIAADLEYDIISQRSYRGIYNYLGQPDHLLRQHITVGAPACLVGAGLKQSLGGRTSGTFEIMYDVIQADYSPYKGTLVYRAGIYVGF